MEATRRAFLGGSSALLATVTMPKFASAQSGNVLRVGLSNGEIPRTTGLCFQGIEGRRFIDNTIYDPFVYYGTKKAGDPNKLYSYLATSLTPDPANKRVWVMELRQGVKFHDGSEFNADAVMWNLDKFFTQNAPQYMPQDASVAAWVSPKLSHWEKRGPFSVAIETANPEPFVPYSFGSLTVASPKRFEEVGRNWEAFARNPSGTGPFKLASVDFKSRAEMVRFDEYWDKNRVARVERMVYTPIFEPNTRTNALVSGQVDWIEAVAPDTIDLVKSRGAKIVTNPYPQVWGYFFDCREGSPFADLRVRQAANLAIDREGMIKVLNGLMIPSDDHYPADHPWHGNPAFKIKYDPQQARALLSAAGYGPDKRIKAKVLATSGGSGMMQPPIMNAFVQGNLREVGIDLEIVTVDWNGLWGTLQLGAGSPQTLGCSMFNFSLATHNPAEVIAEFGSRYFPPNGGNWGFTKSAKVDALVDKLLDTFNPEEQNKLFADFNAAVVDEALALYVAFDKFPRAFAANVSGYVEGYNGIMVQDPTFISISVA